LSIFAGDPEQKNKQFKVDSAQSSITNLG